MHTLPPRNPAPLLQRLENDVLSRLSVAFRYWSHLEGFTLQGSSELPGDADPADEGPFISDIQFSRPVSDYEINVACRFITKTVADIVDERSEATDLLRDRTFARALH